MKYIKKKIWCTGFRGTAIFFLTIAQEILQSKPIINTKRKIPLDGANV